MKVKGLTISMIFEAQSANYGEGVGNVTALKKLTRGNGEAYTYISRQALRYNIVNQMGIDTTKLDLDKEVIQFSIDANIIDSEEIDLFGYMKTKKPVRTRSAVCRLSNAISLESFNSDLDFLTNKGLLDRYNETATKKKDGGNIAQTEIHKSYYAYTITIDLDKVGIDGEFSVDNKEKERRVNLLLDTIKFLYRDIKGRRENLSPIFAIGGVYDIKNPFFENRLLVKNNKIVVEALEDVMQLDKKVKNDTYVGLIKGIFNNDEVIVKDLKATNMGNFFDTIKKQIADYYNN